MNKSKTWWVCVSLATPPIVIMLVFVVQLVLALLG